MLISFFFVTLLFFMVISLYTGAPLVPSKRKTVEKMIELLHIKKRDIVYDLGSGDGRLLIAAAKKGAIGRGIEINPYAVIWSYFNILVERELAHIRIYWSNYWWKSVSPATKVVVYAMPGFMPKMAKKFQKELKKGTLIVSNSFQIPGLTLIRKEEVGKDKIYLYKI